VAVPLEDPSLLTLTGHLAVWGGFNDNGKAVNGTFTFNIGGTGSDGSRFHQNVVEHFNTTPTGATAAAEAVAASWACLADGLCSSHRSAPPTRCGRVRLCPNGLSQVRSGTALMPS